MRGFDDTIMKTLLIDNYDSFTFNLAHDLREIDGVELRIVKNDELEDVDIDSFDRVIISPGPGLPHDNGKILEVIRQFYEDKPILGVCLGLQAICEAFGGELYNLPTVRHGVSSEVTVTDPEDQLFDQVPTTFSAGRYHSWVCDRQTMPEELLITAVDEEGNIMACRHAHFPLHGIQFHPESFLTPHGKQMLENFIRLP